MLAAFAANLGIAATKFAAFLITGSASMLAESVHSVADSGNQALLLVGRSRARREETEEHQFGFGSERYFYGFIVALVLFTVGAVFSVYEGVERISHPERLTSPVVALVVLAIAAVLEGFSFRTAITESHQAGGPRAWYRLVRFIRRAKAPEVPAVLLEDSAALVGLAFAFSGVVLTWITRDGRWDGAGSLGIGVLLGFVAVILAIEMKSLLIGESASAEVERGDRDGSRGRPRGGAGHSPAYPAPGPGDAAGRREDRGQPRAERGRGRGGHRHGGTQGPGGGADRRADLPGARPVPGFARGPHRPRGAGRPPVFAALGEPVRRARRPPRPPDQVTAAPPPRRGAPVPGGRPQPRARRRARQRCRAGAPLLTACPA